MIILVGGTFNALTGWFNTVFTIMRKQQTILFINFAGFIISILVINPLTSQLEIVGAALGYMLVMIFISLAQIIIFTYITHKKKS